MNQEKSCKSTYSIGHGVVNIGHARCGKKALAGFHQQPIPHRYKKSDYASFLAGTFCYAKSVPKQHEDKIKDKMNHFVFIR